VQVRLGEQLGQVVVVGHQVVCVDDDEPVLRAVDRQPELEHELRFSTSLPVQTVCGACGSWR
jgi:hypothetical protein